MLTQQHACIVLYHCDEGDGEGGGRRVHVQRGLRETVRPSFGHRCDGAPGVLGGHYPQQGPGLAMPTKHSGPKVTRPVGELLEDQSSGRDTPPQRAKEPPPKQKQLLPPSTGNKGPGPCAATDEEKDPSPEVVQGSADIAEPMQVTSTEGPEGDEEPGGGGSGSALGVDPLPDSQQGKQSGPEHATEEKTATEFVEGAQEGTIKDHLPQASLSGKDGETEPAPEACTGSADNAGPMQVDSAEGLVGGGRRAPRTRAASDFPLRW
ncbi:UNVERIFIED_CONTAM: hypothetical protein FKN15_042240 [Acipenser sinensis]